MSWTEQDLRAYQQRRLKSEERARTKLYKDYFQPETNEHPLDREFSKLTKEPMGDGLKRAFAATKGYSIPVVTAFFREHGIAEPIYELQFCPERKFRFDLAWVPQKLYLECDGGLFVAGAHVRGASLLREHEKRNLATSLGWRGLWCTPSTICTQETANLVKRCLNL